VPSRREIKADIKGQGASSELAAEKHPHFAHEHISLRRKAGRGEAK